jgi:hypothetical protein
MHKILFFILLPILFQFSIAKAQDTPGQERGEIKDAEFIIRKDRVLTLPKQPRVFEKTPVLPSAQSKGNYSYEVRNFFLDLEPVVTHIQPFQKKFIGNNDPLFHNYIKLGYGNYQSPLGELYINNVESDYMNFGVFLKHQGFYVGPVDGKKSAEDHTNVRFDGSLFQENIEIFGKVGYDRDRHHFYGYDPSYGYSASPAQEIDPEEISQIFHTLYGNVGLRKIDRMELFNYEASLSLQLFNDNYLAREHEVGLKVLLGFRSDNERFQGGIESRAFVSSPSDVHYSDINRNYVKSHPYIAYSHDLFKIKAGANIVFENDVVPNKNSDFHIFPNITANYFPSESFGLYAEYEGDVIRNTYYSFVEENPFLGPSEQLRNTLQNYQIDAGVQGAINEEISYKAGFKFGEYTYMHFYGNHSNDSTKFQLMYDDITQVLNYHASLGWKYEDLYSLNASADYYHYTLSDMENAWHRPEWEINLNNSFIPSKDWFITANANLLGGIRAINLQSGHTTTLNPIIDVSARADYSFSKRFSVFIEGNNLLNQKNERYWNYRVRGIQGIGGLGFKF